MQVAPQYGIKIVFTSQGLCESLGDTHIPRGLQLTTENCYSNSVQPELVQYHEKKSS